MELFKISFKLVKEKKDVEILATNFILNNNTLIIQDYNTGNELKYNNIKNVNKLTIKQI